jgi:hypothetical protein
VSADAHWVTPLRLALLFVVVLATVLGFGAFERRREDEDRLAKIASLIARRDVRIDCPGTLARLSDVTAHDGSVEFSPDGLPADVAKLSSGTCSQLRRLLHGQVAGVGCLAVAPHCSEDAERAAVAVNVLSHEAWHLAGERDEAIAQCYALQTNADTAMRLGTSPEEARVIATFVFRHVQPALPPEYRTYECRDGGPLDLNPERSGWP